MIKADKKENPHDYTIIYHDNVEKINKEIRFDLIKEVNKLYLLVENGNKEINIPVHRIREIKKNKEILWKREEGSLMLGEAI